MALSPTLSTMSFWLLVLIGGCVVEATPVRLQNGMTPETDTGNMSRGTTALMPGIVAQDTDTIPADVAVRTQELPSDVSKAPLTSVDPDGDHSNVFSPPQGSATHITATSSKAMGTDEATQDTRVAGGWGKHQLRIRDNCTAAERRENWEYVLERNQVRQTTIYWDERNPPSASCEYAQVISTPAFAPEFRKLVTETPEWMNHWAIAYFGHSHEGEIIKSEMCEWAMCDVPDTWMYWHPKLAFMTNTISRELGLSRGSPVTVCAHKLEENELYQTTTRYGDRCDCGLMFQAEQQIHSEFEFLFDPFQNNCRDYIAQVLERCLMLQKQKT